MSLKDFYDRYEPILTMIRDFTETLIDYKERLITCLVNLRKWLPMIIIWNGLNDVTILVIGGEFTIKYDVPDQFYVCRGRQFCTGLSNFDHLEEVLKIILIKHFQEVSRSLLVLLHHEYIEYPYQEDNLNDLVVKIVNQNTNFEYGLNDI